MEDQPFQKTWLVSQFENRPVEFHGIEWDDIWKGGKDHFWDRGQASPALVDAVEARQQPGDLFYPFTADGRRKKALVPGCGRGHDAIMLALHGFDAYGIDISEKGVATAQAYASEQLRNPSETFYGPQYRPVKDHSRGEVNFFKGDFFASGWETKLGGKADLIYDYTFLCALHPTMRKDWAAQMASLLTKDGLLTCLEFPMYKDRKLPGPPWGLNGVHYDLLERGGDGLVSNDEATGAEGQGLFSRIIYVQPERSHEAGKGTDMLSIYQLK